MPAPEQSRFYSAPDGLKLHVRVTGTRQDTRLPVVCLPGLTRNHRDFSALAHILASDADAPRQVFAFDYRGRGLSDRDKDWQNYTVPNEAQDVIAGLAALNIAHAHFIGTSRGGLILHLLTAMRPTALKSVILNDIGPELGGAGLAQIRTYLDRSTPPKSWAEAVRMIETGQSKGFPALGPDDIARMAHAIYRENENGIPVADYDPALVNGVRAIDLNAPLPTMWPQFMGFAELPLMVIRGENSDLLTAETLAQMQASISAMTSVTVPGQGHAPLLETGDLPQRIAGFLAKAERNGAA